MEKDTTIPREEILKKLSKDLHDFGDKLKVWEGKEIKEITKSLSVTLKSSMSAYKETNNSDFLLCAFVLQMMFSFVFAKGMMSEVFKTEYVYPKDVMNQLGAKVLELSESVQKTDFVSILKLILAFAYQNDLMPILETSE